MKSEIQDSKPDETPMICFTTELTFYTVTISIVLNPKNYIKQAAAW